MKTFLINHSLEMTAVIAGLLNVYLAARANIWNWLFGIITVSLYVIIFFHSKLYADMSLQFIFLALQFYGWYQWLRGGANHSALATRKADSKIYLIAFFATISFFLIISYILKNYTDSTTIYIDAFTTALSLVAQWMMSKKWIENWLLWMVVDIISIRMYLIKHLYFTTGLYTLFFLICVMGYYTWRKPLMKSQTLFTNQSSSSIN